jgi:hypothetical protein
MHHLSLNSILLIHSQSLAWRVVYTCIATFIINLPFGYMRGRFRKLSFWWFFFIHLPVPLIILTRKFFGLHLTWGLAPFLIGSFFLGQLVGRKIYTRIPWRKQGVAKTTE